MSIVSNAGASLRWLNRNPLPIENVRTGLEEIIREGQRAGKVIRSLQSLTRRQPPVFERLNLHALLHHIVTLSRNELERQHIAVDYRLQAANSLFCGDSVQIQQVLLNLVMNAIEAILFNKGARMTIRLAVPEEAETLWQIRNAAIQHGCKTVYSSEVIEAWTPQTMPDNYRVVIAENPFYVAVTSENIPVASGYLDLRTGSVEAIFTLPQWSGKGLASAIIAVLKQEARRRGFARLTLASTPNACRFYQQQGFRVVRENRHYSKMARADLRCFDMECELTPGE
ncbi:MAG: family acetyltransferase [Proteobacteria bacterium]|nr:family acetyltransferase [Pseudomonadota bacterium]